MDGVLFYFWCIAVIAYGFVNVALQEALVDSLGK